MCAAIDYIQPKGSDKSYPRVSIRDYFDIAIQLITKGAYYKDLKPRYIIPVRQLTLDSHQRLKHASDILVEVGFKPGDLQGKSNDDIDAILADIKAQLDQNIIPDNVSLSGVDQKQINRTHIIDPNGRPFVYVANTSLEQDHDLLCLKLDHDLAWPTSNQNVTVDTGDVLCLPRSRVDELKQRLEQAKILMGQDGTTDNEAIRAQLFLIGGGHYPFARMNIKSASAEDFRFFRPSAE